MKVQRARQILVIDDDRELLGLLQRYFSGRGYRVTTALNGESGINLFDDLGSFDLVILDLNLPGIDGFETCRALRQKSMVPIIMLTGENAEIDRIVGLEVGADDYVTKPFSIRELEARAKSILRRVEAGVQSAETETETTTYRFAGWHLHPARRQLIDPDGKAVPLTGLEYRLLRAFVEHPQRVLSRDQLMNFTKGRDAVALDRSIDVQVGRLRRKLGDPGRSAKFIKTFRGEGYVFAVPVRRDRPT